MGWYKIRLFDGLEERFYSKRFTDFQELDLALKSSGFSPPYLPTSGLLGLRHRLDLGGFNDTRQLNLERYLQGVLASFKNLADSPTLSKFFPPTANTKRVVTG